MTLALLTHLARSFAAALVATMLVACTAVGCYVSHSWRMLVVGALVHHVAMRLVSRLHSREAQRTIAVIGRELPLHTALPTKWRDDRWQTRDVRYAPDSN